MMRNEVSLPTVPVNTARSLLMMAAGALLGLALAGYALFTARGTSTLHVPAEDVALVNQKPISRSDFLIQLNTLNGVDLSHATPEQRTKVLDGLIREELFVQRAEELDLAATDPEIRTAMSNSVEFEIAADAIAEQPTEQALRAYYDAHRERYATEGTMTVRDILFKSDAMVDAQKVADALQSAAPSAALLQARHATESTRAGDEQFYFAARIHLGPQLFAAALHLSDAGVSAPIRDGEFIHVLYMVKNRAPVQLEFDKARDRVLNDYRKSAVARLLSSDEVFLRKRANLQIADDMR
jgi:parvulin-like peptidyl-prolyl isomerase